MGMTIRNKRMHKDRGIRTVQELLARSNGTIMSLSSTKNLK